MIAHADLMAITWGKGSVLANQAGIAISGVTPTSEVGLQMVGGLRFSHTCIVACTDLCRSTYQ